MATEDPGDELQPVELPDLRFSPGSLYITPAARDAVPPEEVLGALQRHLAGDWGDLDEHDRRENERSLAEGWRLLSAYHTQGGEKFWVIVRRDK